MRFRSVLIYLWPLIFLTVPTASAQKRVFAKVDPNTAAINGTADIYDPQTGRITPAAGSMVTARKEHVAVRMADGKVLIAGGYDNRFLRSAEIFDPGSGSFAESGAKLTSARAGAAAAYLQGGTVLIAGGYNGSYLSSAEIYEPESETFSFAANQMTSARLHATATLLSSGTVLITGGYSGAYFLNSAEIFDGKTSKFYTVSSYMRDSREGHAATRLSNGKVLITGGCTNADSNTVICNKYLSSAELFDPENSTFTATGSMTAARMDHSSTILPNGKVLIAGGKSGAATLDSAEIYDPQTGTFTNAGNMTSARMQHTATVLPDGRVLISGGYSDHYLDTAEIFDPNTGTFSAVPTPMNTARFQHTATVLNDGKVFLAGGQSTGLLVFDTNYHNISDNISPNIVFSSDSQTGYVPYAGAGTILAFSAANGAEVGRVVTGGWPAWLTPVPGGNTLLAPSANDNKVFAITQSPIALKGSFAFAGASFGFGSIPVVSPDGLTGYISSTGTGEVIKFDTSTGNELGRLKNLKTPAQITLTKDGATLLVVDTTPNEVIFADAVSMTAKYKFAPLNSYPSTSFTIHSKAVMNQDETTAVVAGQDYGATGILFVFKTSNGEIQKALTTGSNPGFTMLAPNGLWLMLSQDSMSIVPSWDPGAGLNIANPAGTPLNSANIVVSSDMKYAFFTSASTDRVFQEDLTTHAVVGNLLVGDNPNINVDQASSLAFTPDNKTLAVLNFATNQIELLTDAYVLNQPKFYSKQDSFTGTSVINLSGNPANLTFTALSNSGGEVAGESINNPATIQLPPNAQFTMDVSSLFKLDTSIENVGRVHIASDQPTIVGFSDTGTIHSDFLDAYLSNMEGIPMYSGYADELHDFIIPEIPRATSAITIPAELNFVNPNYNATIYDVFHYGTNGTLLEKKEKMNLPASSREIKKITELLSSSVTGQVLIAGGFDARGPKVTSEYYTIASQSFTTEGGGDMGTPRQGHTSTALSNGQILITGGRNGSEVLNSALTYDPVLLEFSTTVGTMNTGRYRHTATALKNGKVLLAGGQDSQSISNTAEIFDPTTSSFAYTSGAMNSPRDAHAEALLPDGKVLITGGMDGVSISSSAEIFDPETSTFTPVGSMSTGRAFHTATALKNGKILIAGGYNGSSLSSAEIFDPETRSFTPVASMSAERNRQTATLLRDGTVLVAGGIGNSGVLNKAELFIPELGKFLTVEGEMVFSRVGHAAVLLPDNDGDAEDETMVLLIGGRGKATDTTIKDDDTSDDTLPNAELYNPRTHLFKLTTGEMSVPRQSLTATVLEGDDQGYVRIKTENGMHFTELFNNGGSAAALNGINVDKFKDITKIYSPQFAILPDYITLLNVINANQDGTAAVTITLHAPDGSVLASPMTWHLPKNGQIKGSLLELFNNDSRLVNRTGWVEVSSSLDKIVGAISFTNSQNEFLVSFVLSGTPLQNFVFPLISEDYTDYGTGIALLNNGDSAATVQLELWNPSGTMDASVSMVLEPKTQVAKPLSSIFQGMRGRRTGNVRVHSDKPIHSLGLLYSLDLHFISAVPPVPYPGQ